MPRSSKHFNTIYGYFTGNIFLRWTMGDVFGEDDGLCSASSYSDPEIDA